MTTQKFIDCVLTGAGLTILATAAAWLLGRVLGG